MRLLDTLRVNFIGVRRLPCYLAPLTQYAETSRKAAHVMRRFYERRFICPDCVYYVLREILQWQIVGD